MTWIFAGGSAYCTGSYGSLEPRDGRPIEGFAFRRPTWASFSDAKICRQTAAFPDYTLLSEDKARCVLDAKSSSRRQQPLGIADDHRIHLRAAGGDPLRLQAQYGRRADGGRAQVVMIARD